MRAHARVSGYVGPMSDFDALLPPEMARKAEDVGVRKAGLPTLATLLLAVLAGAFIALGAAFATVALTGTAGLVPYGWARVVAGLCFSVGLGMVLVGGAELFTGNNLLVMAWASGRVSTRAVLRNWALVYAGNTAGAVGTAVLVWASGVVRGPVAETAVSIAKAKLALDPLSAFASGVLCNTLVCLAVWLSLSARATSDRLVAIALPVAAFVAMGFEHCIANLYFFPLAWLVGAPGGWGRFLLHNLLPVTVGNVVGGAVLVAAVYWGIYLRKPGPA